LPHYWHDDVSGNLQKFSWYFNRGIDTLKIKAFSNHKPGILNNYIRIVAINYKRVAVWLRLFDFWLHALYVPCAAIPTSSVKVSRHLPMPRGFTCLCMSRLSSCNKSGSHDIAGKLMTVSPITLIWDLFCVFLLFLRNIENKWTTMYQHIW